MEWSKTGGYDNKISFSVVDIPELEPIPGARKKPGVEYLWLFGDGRFSFEESPVHIYDRIQYEPYDAEFYLTYTYTDTGKNKRKKGRQRIAFNPGGNNTTGPSASDAIPFGRKDKSRSVLARTNQDAIAGQSFVAILSYRNTSDQPMNGRLDFYYNEQATCDGCFLIEEEPRLNNGETRQSLGGLLSLWNSALAAINPIPAPIAFDEMTIEDVQDEFLNKEVFEFSNLEAGATKNIFIVMKTDEAMTDTSLVTHALLKIRNSAGQEIDAYTLPIELVSSHDPNSILAANNKGRMDRKFMLPWKRNDDIKFQINFQNNGDGPASKVRVVSEISRKLDYTTLKVKEAVIGKEKIRIDEDSVFYYQAYPDSLVFHFRDVYLSGTGQSSTKKKDSKGHITYTIKTGKKAPRVINSRANIYFDSNENVITKRSKIRLKKGTRFVLEAGAIFPSAPEKWRIPAIGFSMDNKYLGIGTSALLPKRSFSMDVGMKYSREVYEQDFEEPGVEVPMQTFNHLSFNFTPQVDLLPFLRIGLDLEAGVLLSGKLDNNREFFLFGQEHEQYGPLRYGGALKILLGRTQNTGLSIGGAYYTFHDKLPIFINTAGLVEAQWHDGFRVFLRYKI